MPSVHSRQDHNRDNNDKKKDKTCPACGGSGSECPPAPGWLRGGDDYMWWWNEQSTECSLCGGTGKV